MGPLTSRDRAVFEWNIAEQLDAIPLRTPDDARVVARALQSLIEPSAPASIPSSIQERVHTIAALVSDPLSVEDAALYPEGQLRQYQDIAITKIHEKIQKLLHLSPENITQEHERQVTDHERRLMTQEDIRPGVRQAPTGEASTISEAEWLEIQQEEFQREAPPPRFVWDTIAAPRAPTVAPITIADYFRMIRPPLIQENRIADILRGHQHPILLGRGIRHPERTVVLINPLDIPPARIERLVAHARAIEGVAARTLQHDAPHAAAPIHYFLHNQLHMDEPPRE